MKQFTWYYSHVGCVSVFEGDVNEINFEEVMTAEEARTAHIREIHHHGNEEILNPFSIRALFGIKPYKTSLPKYTHTTYEQIREPIKYFIPKEYVETFFILIGSPTYWHGSSGVTTVDVSEFLED